MKPLTAIGFLWIVWIFSWMAAAFWASRMVKQMPWRDEMRFRVPYLIGVALFWIGISAMTSLVGFAGWSMFAVMVAGLAFAWWARLHLGPLWSSRITRNEGHRIVDTGPYALTRHPIYTGIMTAAVATSVTEWRWQAVIGAALIAGSLWYKAGLEERFLREELGRDAYDLYARRVPMLIPFWPRTR